MVGAHFQWSARAVGWRKRSYFDPAALIVPLLTGDTFKADKTAFSVVSNTKRRRKIMTRPGQSVIFQELNGEIEKDG